MKVVDQNVALVQLFMQQLMGYGYSMETLPINQQEEKECNQEKEEKVVVTGKEREDIKGPPNVPEIVDIPEGPAVTSSEEWQKVITGRKAKKATEENTQYRNEYEVLRYDGDEE